MEENVALDSKKQNKFAKSIKGIKDLLKKNEGKPRQPAVLAPKDTDDKPDKKKRKRKERGLVYLSHIPHGFYEHEMTQYFKQFGMVTNVRVIRSPRTGRSKGFAFVEFREPAVAEIVAETMNNYLMGKRLIKAAIIPPEKQKRRAMRKHWTSERNPTVERRIKMKKAFNSNKDEAGNLDKAKKLLKNFEQKKKKLMDLGINIDFVTPVDVPEALLERVQGKQENETKIVNVKVDGAKQKKNQSKAAKTVEKMNTKEKKKETVQVPATEVKSKKELKKAQQIEKLQQNEKQKKLKNAIVKPLEDFLKIEQEGEESDSSVEFDSDEYEKMLDDSDAASGESDDDDSSSAGGSGEDDGDDSEEELPPLIPVKAKKGKKPIVAVPPQPKKAAKPANIQKGQKTPQIQQLPKTLPQPVLKRKTPQPGPSPKKPKFEKKDKKQRNKQFKKKCKAN